MTVLLAIILAGFLDPIRAIASLVFVYLGWKVRYYWAVAALVALAIYVAGQTFIGSLPWTLADVAAGTVGVYLQIAIITATVSTLRRHI